MYEMRIFLCHFVPLTFTTQGGGFTSGNILIVLVSDTLCRFPDNIKYTITLENVACASGAIRILSNLFAVAVVFLLLRF